MHGIVYCDDHCSVLTDTNTLLCNAHMDVVKRLRTRQMVTFILCGKLLAIPIDILKHIHSFLRVETARVPQERPIYDLGIAQIQRHYGFDDVATHEQVVAKQDATLYGQ